jgi:hypothetical protein
MRHLSFAAVIYLALFGCEGSTKTPVSSANSTGVKSSSDTSGASAQSSNPKSAMPIVCDIKKLAGKSPKQVQKLYGKPDISVPTAVHVGPCKEQTCNRYTYQHEKIEVVFINGKADWITVNEVGSFPLSADAIKLLGLPATSPSFENPDNVIRWSSVDGIREISAFSNGSGGISYFYIHCQTSL